jgi:hypothetical protein
LSRWKVFLPALLILGLGCRPSGKAGRIDLKTVQAELGTGGLVDQDRWNRVLVSAASVEGLFQGEVEVSGRALTGGSSLENFRREFAASKEGQACELMVQPRGWEELEVTFRSPGWRGAGKQTLDWSAGRGVPDPTQKTEFRILAIAEARFTARSLVPAVEKWLKAGGRVSFGAITPADMPAHFLGYEVADLVVLERTALAGADPARIEALREWVERGGVIAAVPGPDWTGLLPQSLKEIFGVSAPPKASGEPGESEGQVFTVEAAEGARLIRDRSLVENRFGSGLAFLHTFAPPRALLEITAEGNAGPAAAAGAWLEVVERCRAHPRTSGPAMAGVKGAAVQALIWFSGFRYPPRKAVLLFALGYLGIGFFATGIFFRRRRKLERMYLVALALAILSCVGIYRFGLLSAVTGQSLDEVTVATMRAGSTIADAASFLGVSSGDHRTVEPRLPGRGGLESVPSQPMVEMEHLNPLTGVPGVEAGLLPLEYRFSGRAVEIPALRLYPNATRYLRYDYPLDLGGRLEAAIGKDEDGAEVLSVKNSTRFALELSLVDGDTVRRGGSIAEGGTRVLNVAALDSQTLPAAEESPDVSVYPRGGRTVYQSRGGTVQVQVGMESGPDAHSGLSAALERSLRGSRCLVAQTNSSLFPGAGLGTVRHSMTFLLVALPPPEGR